MPCSSSTHVWYPPPHDTSPPIGNEPIMFAEPWLSFMSIHKRVGIIDALDASPRYVPMRPDLPATLFSICTRKNLYERPPHPVRPCSKFGDSFDVKRIHRSCVLAGGGLRRGITPTVISDVHAAVA